MVTRSVQMLLQPRHALAPGHFLSHQQVVDIVRSYLRIAFFCVLPVIGLNACDNPGFGRLDPLIAVDSTVVIAAPIAAETRLPSALDVTATGGVIRGGRFPERVQDANLGWDLAVRIREGQLVFVASTGLGLPTRAGITAPLLGQTLQMVREVPSGAVFETSTAVPVQVGAVYVIRSREFSTGFGACLQYGKLQVTEADAAAGTVRMRVETNERCYDTRLVEADS
jgi:hypothetical protein